MPKKKPYPRRLRRDESFLGIHFDFHAREKCTEIGKNVTRRMIERIIDEVQPDYIQCDCKGSRGLSSYPTEVGNPAPGFVRDQLKLWREVTAERGVALYVHYSGVRDLTAIRRHPSWARVDENGNRDKGNTSVFGPYVDKLLILQLKELSDKYKVDGAWVDAECWAVGLDYHKNALKAFRQQTGIGNVPRKPGDLHFREFAEFCREGFRKYVNHYVTALHEHNRQFQVASNWAYTSYMPEPCRIDVDFISGDYPPGDSVNTARMEARCIAPQGKSWDMMAWSFRSRWGGGCNNTKSIPQLQQEAAVVLAAGGGFQAYFKQKDDASIHEWQMKLMQEVAKFCRARQKVCHRARPVPQIALLNSGFDFYRRSVTPFRPPEGGKFLTQDLWRPLSGVLNALLDSQNSVEILSEHHLAGRMADYPVIVVPESQNLALGFRRDLTEYVRKGGNLLIIGPIAARMFQKELGVRLVGRPAEVKKQWIEHDGWMAGVKAISQRVKLGQGVKRLGGIYAENDNKGPSEVAASVRSLGKGKIAATYLNLGERYVKARSPVVRDWLNSLVRQLFPRPTVEVAGSHYVDVSVNRIDGKLAVNLINTAGPHGNANVYVFDEIPPIGPLTVTIRTKRRPNSVTIMPSGRKLRHSFSNGCIRIKLPRLAIHDIIVVE